MNKRHIFPNVFLTLSLLALATISCVAIKSATPIITRLTHPENLWLKQLFFYFISFIVIYITYSFGTERIFNCIWRSSI